MKSSRLSGSISNNRMICRLLKLSTISVLVLVLAPCLMRARAETQKLADASSGALIRELNPDRFPFELKEELSRTELSTAIYASGQAIAPDQVVHLLMRAKDKANNMVAGGVSAADALALNTIRASQCTATEFRNRFARCKAWHNYHNYCRETIRAAAAFCEKNLVKLMRQTAREMDKIESISEQARGKASQ